MITFKAYVHVKMYFCIDIVIINLFEIDNTIFKECMSDSVTNYNYVGDTKISVSI